MSYCPICGYMEGMDNRSHKQLALYWSLLALLCKYQTAPVFSGRDGVRNFHETLKIAIDYVEPVYNFDGTIKTWKPKSVAFNKMNSQEFSAFFDAAEKYIFGEIIPSIGDEDLETEALKMLKQRGPNDK